MIMIKMEGLPCWISCWHMTPKLFLRVIKTMKLMIKQMEIWLTRSSCLTVALHYWHITIGFYINKLICSVFVLLTQFGQPGLRSKQMFLFIFASTNLYPKLHFGVCEQMFVKRHCFVVTKWHVSHVLVDLFLDFCQQFFAL